METHISKLLLEIKARLAAATPGPWVHRPGGVVQSQAVSRIIFWDDCPNVGDTHEMIQPDYSLIAHAPADIAKLLAIVEVMHAALEKFQTIPAAPDAFIELAMCEMRSFASEALLAADKLAGGE